MYESDDEIMGLIVPTKKKPSGLFLFNTSSRIQLLVLFQMENSLITKHHYRQTQNNFGLAYNS